MGFRSFFNGGGFGGGYKPQGPGMATTGQNTSTPAYGAPPTTGGLDPAVGTNYPAPNGNTGIVPPNVAPPPPMPGMPTPPPPGGNGAYRPNMMAQAVGNGNMMGRPMHGDPGPGYAGRPLTGRGSGMGGAGAAAPRLGPGDNWQANQEANVAAQMKGLQAQGAAGNWAPYADHALGNLDAAQWDPNSYGAIEQTLNDRIAGGNQFLTAVHGPGYAAGPNDATGNSVSQAQAQLAALRKLQGR